MKTTINPTTTAERLAEITAAASRAGATHAHVLKAGGKRAGIVPLAELDATYRGTEAAITFGTKLEGLPFEPLASPEHKEAPLAPSEDSAGTSAAPVPLDASDEDTLAPDQKQNPPSSPQKQNPPSSPQKQNPPGKSRIPTTKTELSPQKDNSHHKNSTPPSRPVGTGFMAAIDKMLLDLDEKAGVVEGFRRSKHSVAEAHAIVSKAFPQKDPASIKKIIKVRPRHLEKQKGEHGFDEAKNRAPRWRFVGPGKTYESPERLVTEMINARKKDAEILTRVGQLFPSCTKVDTAFLAVARDALARSKQAKLPPAQLRKAKEEAKARIEKVKTKSQVRQAAAEAKARLRKKGK